MINTEQQAIDIFDKILQKRLPIILYTQTKIIQIGIVNSIDNNTHTCNITLNNTNQEISGLKVSRNITTLAIGNTAYIIFPDTNNVSTGIVIGYY